MNPSMMMWMTFEGLVQRQGSRLLLLALAIGLPGCWGDLEATNPFDEEADINLQRKGTITGAITLEGETNHEAVTVALSAGGASGKTKSDGSFRLENIVPGNHRLVVSRDEKFRQLTTDEFAVDIGENVDVGKYTLIRGRGRVAGKVSGTENGLGGVRVTVQLTGLDNTFVFDAVANAAGEFEFADTPIGQYVLSATAEGFAKACGSTVEVKKDLEEIDNVAIQLSQQGFTLAIAGGTEFDGKTYLAGPEAVVTLTAPGADEVRIGVRGETFETAAFAKPLPEYTMNLGTMDPASGPKFIGVQVKDKCGGEGKAVFTPVVVDMEAPDAKLSTIRVTNGVSGADGKVYLRDPIAALEIVPFDSWNATAQMEIAVDDQVIEGGAITFTPVKQVGVNDGENELRVTLIDAAGNRSEPVPLIVQLDREAPEAPDVSINGGAALSNSSSVRLALSATGASEMRIGNLQNVEDGIWQPFTATTSWVVGNPGDDGLKVVYAKFRDPALNETAVVQAEIELDTQPPTDLVVELPDGRTDFAPQLLDGGALEVSLQAVGAAMAKLYFGSTSGTATVISFSQGATAATGTVKVPAVAAGHSERVNLVAVFADAAGNEATVTRALNLDAAAPGGSFQIDPEGLTTKLRTADGVRVTNSAEVSLQLLSGDAVDVKIAVDGETGFGITANGIPAIPDADGYFAYSSNVKLTLADVPGQAVMKTVRVTFKDAAGNTTEASGSFLLDQEAPDLGGSNPLALLCRAGSTCPIYTQPEAGSQAKVGGSDVMLEITLPTGNDITEMLIANASTTDLGEPDDRSSTWETVRGLTSWSLDGAEPGAEVTAAVFVKFRDLAGNESDWYSRRTIIDLQPPQGAEVKFVTQSTDQDVSVAFAAPPGMDTGTMNVKLSATDVSAARAVSPANAFTDGKGNRDDEVLFDLPGTAAAQSLHTLVAMPVVSSADDVVTFSLSITFADEFGNTNSTVSDSVTLTRPQGKVTVNAGCDTFTVPPLVTGASDAQGKMLVPGLRACSTKDRVVTLTFDAPAAIKMAISGDVMNPSTTPIDYVAEYGATLTPNSDSTAALGTLKKIQVDFYDANGVKAQVSEGAYIILDQKAPVISDTAVKFLRYPPPVTVQQGGQGQAQTPPDELTWTKRRDVTLAVSVDDIKVSKDSQGRWIFSPDLSILNEWGLEVAVTTTNPEDCSNEDFVPFRPFIPNVALLGTEGDNEVYICMRDRAGNITSPAKRFTLTYDDAGPKNVFLEIEGGVAITNKTSLLTKILGWQAVPCKSGETNCSCSGNNCTRPDISLFKIWGGDTSPASVSFTKFDSANTGTTVAIPSTFNGIASVRGQFADANCVGYTTDFDIYGKCNVTEVFSSIIVDTKAPKAPTLKLENGAEWTNNLTATLSIERDSADADVADMKVTVTSGAGDSTSGFQSYTTTAVVPFTVCGSGDSSTNYCTRTVKVVLRDTAGNESSATSKSIKLDTKKPARATWKKPSYTIVNYSGNSVRFGPISAETPAGTTDDTFSHWEVQGGDFIDFTKCKINESPPQNFSSCDVQSVKVSILLNENLVNFIKVRGVDFAGNESEEDVLQIEEDSTKPKKPEITFVEASDQAVFLRWKSGGDADISGYRVHYGTVPGKLTGNNATNGVSPIDVGNATSFRLTGLTNGQPVYVAVQALDRVQEQQDNSSGNTVISNKPNESDLSLQRRIQPNEVTPSFNQALVASYNSVVTVKTEHDSANAAGKKYGVSIFSNGHGVYALETSDNAYELSSTNNKVGYFDLKVPTFDVTAINDTQANQYGVAVAAGDRGFYVLDGSYLFDNPSQNTDWSSELPGMGGGNGGGVTPGLVQVPETSANHVAFIKPEAGQSSGFIAVGGNQGLVFYSFSGQSQGNHAGSSSSYSSDGTTYFLGTEIRDIVVKDQDIYVVLPYGLTHFKLQNQKIEIQSGGFPYCPLELWCHDFACDLTSVAIGGAEDAGGGGGPPPSPGGPSPAPGDPTYIWLLDRLNGLAVLDKSTYDQSGFGGVKGITPGEADSAADLDASPKIGSTYGASSALTKDPIYGECGLGVTDFDPANVNYMRLRNMRKVVGMGDFAIVYGESSRDWVIQSGGQRVNLPAGAPRIEIVQTVSGAENDNKAKVGNPAVMKYASYPAETSADPSQDLPAVQSAYLFPPALVLDAAYYGPKPTASEAASIWLAAGPLGYIQQKVETDEPLALGTATVPAAEGTAVGDTYRITKADDLLMIADGVTGLRIADFSLPLTPKPVGAVALSGLSARGVSFAGPYGIVAAAKYQTTKIDIYDLAKARDNDTGTSVQAADKKDGADGTGLEFDRTDFAGYRLFGSAGTYALTVNTQTLFTEPPGALQSSDLTQVSLSCDGTNNDWVGVMSSMQGDEAVTIRHRDEGASGERYELALWKTTATTSNTCPDTNTLKPSRIKLPAGATPREAQLADNLLYVADPTLGLLIYDIHKVTFNNNYADESGNASLLKALPMAGLPRNVKVSHGFAYVSTENGVVIVDVSDPEQASQVGFVPVVSGAYDVVEDGQLLYVAGRAGGVSVYDAMKPGLGGPASLTSLTAAGEAKQSALLRQHLFVVNTRGDNPDSTTASPWTWQLDVFDFSNPYSPKQVTFDDPQTGRPYRGVTGVMVHQDELYLMQIWDPDNANWDPAQSYTADCDEAFVVSRIGVGGVHPPSSGTDPMLKPLTVARSDRTDANAKLCRSGSGQAGRVPIFDVEGRRAVVVYHDSDSTQNPKELMQFRLLDMFRYDSGSSSAKPVILSAVNYEPGTAPMSVRLRDYAIFLSDSDDHFYAIPITGTTIDTANKHKTQGPGERFEVAGNLFFFINSGQSMGVYRMKALDKDLVLLTNISSTLTGSVAISGGLLASGDVAGSGAARRGKGTTLFDISDWLEGDSTKCTSKGAPSDIPVCKCFNGDQIATDENPMQSPQPVDACLQPAGQLLPGANHITFAGPFLVNSNELGIEVSALK